MECVILVLHNNDNSSGSTAVTMSLSLLHLEALIWEWCPTVCYSHVKQKHIHCLKALQIDWEDKRQLMDADNPRGTEKQYYPPKLGFLERNLGPTAISGPGQRVCRWGQKWKEMAAHHSSREERGGEDRASWPTHQQQLGRPSWFWSWLVVLSGSPNCSWTVSRKLLKTASSLAVARAVREYLKQVMSFVEVYRELKSDQSIKGYLLIV